MRKMQPLFNKKEKVQHQFCGVSRYLPPFFQKNFSRVDKLSWGKFMRGLFEREGIMTDHGKIGESFTNTFSSNLNIKKKL